jgi:hypothetical protein
MPVSAGSNMIFRMTIHGLNALMILTMFSFSLSAFVSFCIVFYETHGISNNLLNFYFSRLGFIVHTYCIITSERYIQVLHAMSLVLQNRTAIERLIIIQRSFIIWRGLRKRQRPSHRDQARPIQDVFMVSKSHTEQTITHSKVRHDEVINDNGESPGALAKTGTTQVLVKTKTSSPLCVGVSKREDLMKMAIAQQ